MTNILVGNRRVTCNFCSDYIVIEFFCNVCQAYTVYSLQAAVISSSFWRAIQRRHVRAE